MLTYSRTTFLLVCTALAGPSHAASLRSASSSSTTVDSNATLSIGRRRFLQSNTTSQEPLSEDASLLNELIALVLPYINEGIAAVTPDPLDLDIAGTFEVGSIDFGCGDTGLDVTYNWGGISGLSTFFIDTLTIIGGTEEITASATTSEWKGTFTMGVASTQAFSIDDLGAGFDARACGVSWDESIGGTLTTAEPFLGGAVELAGSLCNGRLSIDVASILDSLDVGYETVTAQLDDAPAIVNAFLGPASERMSVLLENDLVTTVEPEMRPIIEAQLEEQGDLFAPTKIFPIHAKLVRNAAVRRANKLYSETLQFFSGMLAAGEEDITAREEPTGTRQRK